MNEEQFTELLIELRELARRRGLNMSWSKPMYINGRLSSKVDINYQEPPPLGIHVEDGVTGRTVVGG